MTQQEITALLEEALGRCDGTMIDRCMIALGALERGIACDADVAIQYWPVRVTVADIFAALASAKTSC